MTAKSKDPTTDLFAVLSTQRSGSTMLTEMLDSHPRLRCLGEAFRSRNEQEWSYAAYNRQERRKGSAPDRLAPVHAYLSRLQMEGDGAHAIGFKVMYNQALRHPALVAEFAVRRLLVVHLVRRDLLAAYVSNVIARQTRRYHARQRVENQQVCVPIKEALGAIEGRRRRALAARSALHIFKSIEVAYEDLRAEASVGLAPILGELGVPPASDLRASTVKIVADDLSKVVSNWDQLTEAMASAGIGRFLE